jgi:hypothetical protein
MDQLIENLCRDYFNETTRDMPEYATIMGIHDYDGDLHEATLKAYENRINKTKNFYEKIKKIDHGTLSSTDS